MNGEYMNAKKRVAGLGLTATLVVSLLSVVGAASAHADTGAGSTASGNSAKQCLVEPEKTRTVHHDATYKDVFIQHEGEDAVTHGESRWMREIPAVDAVTHEETQYTRTISAEDEVSYEQWKYSLLVPGLDEVSHLEYQFSRENPGSAEVSHKEYLHKREIPKVDEVSHLEYQFSRQNPGQAEQSHKERQFYRDVEGQKEVSHQEYTYSQSYTEYRFQSRVKRPDNTVERKFIKGYDFVSGGTTRVSGQNVAGHWVQSAGWHAIPDVIINIVWGSGGVPSQYLGGSESHPKGNVGLSVYGGPNVNAPYYASLETITGGYTDWGPWSEWSTTNPGGNTDTRNVETQPVTLLYKDGAWTTDTPGAPWVKTDERKVTDQEAVAGHREYRAADGSATLNEADAAWFSDTSFDGWLQYGQPKKVVDAEKVDPFTEYRAADGTASPNLSDAAWFLESSFDGWNQLGEPKKVVDQELVPAYTEYRAADGSPSRNEADAAWSPDRVIDSWGTGYESRTVVDAEKVDPFTEYRAADGSASTHEADAAWFSESTFDGWSQFGESKKVVDQSATDDVTYYLVDDGEGNLTQSTDRGDASWFTAAPAGLDPSATEFDREKVTVKEAVPEQVLYLTVDEDGVFGETEDPAEASWIPLADDNGVDTTLWSRVIDSETNEPIARVVTDEEAILGYTEYYVSNSEPTRELGDSNWTVDQPEGWTLVDERVVTDKEAIAPWIERTKGLKKAAWDEKVTTPATYGACTLAITGGSPILPIGIAAVTLLLLGAGVAVYSVRRNRRQNENAQA